MILLDSIWVYWNFEVFAVEMSDFRISGLLILIIGFHLGSQIFVAVMLVLITFWILVFVDY